MKDIHSIRIESGTPQQPGQHTAFARLEKNKEYYRVIGVTRSTLEEACLELGNKLSEVLCDDEKR